MIKTLYFLLTGVIVILTLLFSYLLWPLEHIPRSANHDCLMVGKKDGHLIPLQLDKNSIYGVALSYAGIIDQSGSEFNRNEMPPIFRKYAQALNIGDGVASYPTTETVLKQVEKLESELAETLQNHSTHLNLLIDYEVELGFVLLESIERQQLNERAFSSELGYFLANDLQSFVLTILGVGQKNEAEFFDAKGSFKGFLPTSSMMWVPNSKNMNSNLCINISTTVNGELRQSANTRDRIYTNRQLIEFIFQKYSLETLPKGTAIITGSPAGVANRMPRWKRRLGRLLKMGRFEKLSSVLKAAKSHHRFLKPGDVVVIDSDIFDRVVTKIN